MKHQQERGTRNEGIAESHGAGVAAGVLHQPGQAADDATAAKALLEKALAYYHDQGDKAFAAFSRQGEFVDKDRYVFVVDTKG